MGLGHAHATQESVLMRRKMARHYAVVDVNDWLTCGIAGIQEVLVHIEPSEE